MEELLQFTRYITQDITILIAHWKLLVYQGGVNLVVDELCTRNLGTWELTYLIDDWLSDLLTTNCFLQ